ncbi:hypothetical protein PHSY_004981 [Pseudozyma hubeiensis SY62]|uniref:Uncharacterized protein n=1 Tax=Pseudozyma hubeiensis (strain SY62) TaxID=1305764 RepID=R9P7R9_PSEHS|nr:hypothetical protein PHSY_004981 [Pseudozyma hubeiensis SY62]GAC97396.1 hypothetical protein PHSY_004981 [Pseudozyma hubeiensis SY62]
MHTTRPVTFCPLRCPHSPRPRRLDARRLDSLCQMSIDTDCNPVINVRTAAAAAAAAAASVNLFGGKLETGAVACSFGHVVVSHHS